MIYNHFQDVGIPVSFGKYISESVSSGGGKLAVLN